MKLTMSITLCLPEEIKFSFTGNSVSKRREFFLAPSVPHREINKGS